MDPLTHGLAAYALKRAFFSRQGREVTVAMILAAVIGDLDWTTYYFGPRSFLRGHATVSDSLFGVVLISLIVAAICRFAGKREAVAQISIGIFLASVCAGLLRLILDVCSSSGVGLYWPFRNARVALDWLPSLDPWIPIILIAAILLPELFSLISGEIGVRSRGPRGRAAAISGLVLLAAYGSMRATLHHNAVSLLQSRSYEGQAPRRAAAYPDTTSLFTWHGITETESALHILDINAVPGAFFNPDAALNLHKPESSPALQAVQSNQVSKEFLEFARFPKATIEQETSGFLAEIHDLRYQASGQTLGAIQVEVNLDAGGKVTFAQLEWEKPRPGR